MAPRPGLRVTLVSPRKEWIDHSQRFAKLLHAFLDSSNSHGVRLAGSGEAQHRFYFGG